MTQRETRFPGYDVLRKVSTQSWDDATRRVVDERMSVPSRPRFFNALEWQTVQSLCFCIVPQASANPPVPIAAMLDSNLVDGIKDGFRDAKLPLPQEAWRLGLAALNAESERVWHVPFADLEAAAQKTLLQKVQEGDVKHASWDSIPPSLFFSARVLHDICGAYYAHPHAWSEIGFGGPANPRGYVRLYFDKKDPWEAVEQKALDEATAAEAHAAAVRLENARAR